jgi:hypothetical protein
VLAKGLLDTDPKSTLDGAIWSIIGKKAADEDIVLIEKRAPYVSGTKKFSFGFALNNYLKHVKSEESFKRGVDVYTTMVLNENMKQYRSSLGGFVFQAGGDQKDAAKSDNKDDAAVGQRKFDYVKVALQKIMDAEKDPETQKDFKKMWKDNIE